MPHPVVGALAPDFTLPSTSGKDVTLSSFRGSKTVLLAFFPLAFTGTCSAELHAFSEDLTQFENRNTVVLPISVDSVPALREFKAKGKMLVDLLSDFRRTVSQAYGVLIDEKYHSSRAYVVIDRQGVVRWFWEEAELGHKRDNAELLQQLALVQ
ncbi:MAG TPA: redoxin domain-containing protein [Gemmatimonadales bacterium]|jgi:peroxiredoxin (alkyl hydroperoxide reductase subunit C)|nr:redoxin domain-containing protein [Gemmatimonadales bacterium]